MQFCEESEKTPEQQVIQFDQLKLRLAHEHSLWSHVLWNSSKLLYDLILKKEIDVFAKSVYELGCGCAIPSIISLKSGANFVVATEYPDADLISNVNYNFTENLSQEQLDRSKIIGKKWGQQLLDDKFDLIFQCDLVFNHSEHDNLITEICNNMKPDGTTHVIFSHHRPQYTKQDLDFFRKCELKNLKCKPVRTVKMERMFKEDDNIYEIATREDVHWWIVTF